MKMDAVRAGMRLRSHYFPHEEVTVTEITERGFKYEYDEARPMVPRWGWVMAKDGHEHFGLDGEALYEPCGGQPE